MTNLNLLVSDSPYRLFYPGMEITGILCFQTHMPRRMKAIKVQLFGQGSIDFLYGRTHYHHIERCVDKTLVLWEKIDSSNGGEFGPGNYQFPFSIQLPQCVLPSFKGRHGEIKYSLRGTLMMERFFERNESVQLNINVGTIVRMDRPELCSPRVAEHSKTICCFCCASAPIVMNVRIPRIGYLAGNDTIPIKVSVENGSNQRIIQMYARLTRVERFTADTWLRHAERSVTKVIGSLDCNEPVEPRSDKEWQCAMDVANTYPTLTASRIIEIGYLLKVGIFIPGAIDLTAEFPIVLGNTGTVA